MVFTGYIKTAGTIEPAKAIERQVNTLELVVMSKCPFGTRAEDAVIEHLKTMSQAEQAPTLDVRYLFYKKEEPLPEIAGPIITLRPGTGGAVATTIPPGTANSGTLQPQPVSAQRFFQDGGSDQKIRCP